MKLAVLLALLFTGLVCLGVVCYQIKDTPSHLAPLFSLEAIWPSYAATWAKATMWGCVIAFGVLFHAWKKD